MSRVFITGSADGLGLLAAQKLIAEGHQVLLHARSEKRAKEALQKLPRAEGAVTGDLSELEETKELASKVNALGVFDAVIHNAGVYQTSADQIFWVNTLAPYILTCLVQRPQRLIYLSSDMHLQGRFRPEGLKKPGYSDSKLHVVMLCKAVAGRWPGVYANAVNPGWVPTRMGGAGAPDDLQKGCETQAWLATSDAAEAMVSGRYFFHQREARYNPQADDVQHQELLLRLCGEVSGVAFPG